MTLTLTWDIPPDVLAEATRRYGERIQQAVEQVARILEPRLLAYAQTNAPWTDRTGNARSGLSTRVTVARDLVTLYLYHSMSYGYFLEVARGGRYAILWPSIEAVFPEVWTVLRGLIGGGASAG